MIRWSPQLATLADAPPRGDGWLHELKFDGYRVAAFGRKGEIHLITRNGNDWTSTFPEVVDAVRALEVRSVTFDGEVAILLPNGLTSFQELQNAIARKPPRKRLVYFVFDLLEHDGVDLSARPVEERKAALEALLRKAPGDGVLRFSEHVVGNGDAMFEQACRLGAEGIVSKRLGQPYRGGRGGSWLKVKCVKRQEFVIGGFTDPEGSRAGIGALLVGFHAPDGRFTFAGKVGTGFTNASARALRKLLEPIEISDCPFSPRPEGWLGRNAHWVRPERVCEVRFGEWTGDGKLRHPSFQGLREDKAAKDVVREQAAHVATEAPSRRRAKTAPAVPRDAAAARGDTAEEAGEDEHASRTRPRSSASAARASRTGGRTRTTAADRPVVAGLRISHPERVVFPDFGFTKLDLARFYEAIAPHALPHLVDRPLTLFRCPGAISDDCAFMKHSKLWAPDALRRVRIQEKTKVGEYLICDTTEALVALAQMDVVEVHTWNSRFAHVEQPDRIVLDLDPGPQVAWKDVVSAARTLRGMLEALGLRSFVKTTGGTGLHVVVPLVPDADWTECLAFSRAVAEAFARQDLKRFTTAFAKKGREAKILIDYLRNNRTNTSVAAFSTRARPGAPVSVPLSWDELTPKLKSDAFTVRNLFTRLGRQKRDPWAESFTLKQRLPKEAVRVLERL